MNDKQSGWPKENIKKDVHFVNANGSKTLEQACELINEAYGYNWNPEQLKTSPGSVKITKTK